MNRIGYVKLTLMVSIVAVVSSTMAASANSEPENSRSGGRSLCVCSRMYDPICASNGITYGNECTFSCAARTRTDLKIVKRDVCDVDSDVWEEIPHPY